MSLLVFFYSSTFISSPFFLLLGLFFSSSLFQRSPIEEGWPKSSMCAFRGYFFALSPSLPPFVPPSLTPLSAFLERKEKQEGKKKGDCFRFLFFYPPLPSFLPSIYFLPSWGSSPTPSHWLHSRPCLRFFGVVG